MDEVTLRLLREELVAVSRRGYQRGLVVGVSGNNSVRVPGTELVLIKATGGCMGEMDVSDTVLMRLDGTVCDAGRRPSKEWRWHLEVYRSRPDVGGIVHLHPPHAVAFAVADQPIPLVHTAARAHLRRVGVVGLLPAGSAELAAEVVRVLSDTETRVVVMREHGTITVGPDLRTAHYRTEYLEDNARVALLAARLRLTTPAGLRLAEDAEATLASREGGTAPLAEVGG
jgi:L-ribulose-5-phosphate 4-epimerase